MDEVDVTQGIADLLRSGETLKGIRQAIAYVDPLARAGRSDQLFPNEQRIAVWSDNRPSAPM
jgi:hypothetical protein